ncbi:MAG: aspartate aminotransferase family protein [Flavobacteriales bacterium]
MEGSNTTLLDGHLAQTTMHPFALHIERADGIYLYDKQGKAYMDMISGVGVSNLGHGNKQIADAIKQQVYKHLHVMVYGEFVQEAQMDAARELTSWLPPSLDTCYFVNSGTEAVEASLKLAKRVTGRQEIIAMQGAYHGNTHGSMSVSSNETKKSAFRPLLPGISFIPFNDESSLRCINESTACVITETIQGDAGIRIPDVSYMKALRMRCSETGTLLILDEIQCGMGRAGSMFAFQQMDIVPDVLVLGKALGGGMPVGCVVSSRKNMERLTHDPMLGHISTFAGHPVVCAAVAATLKVYKQEDILRDVETKGQWLAAQLRTHNAVKEVRQRGLFIAVDLESAEKVQIVVQRCLDDGLISFWFLSCPASFRLAPPLTTTQLELEKAYNILQRALD